MAVRARCPSPLRQHYNVKISSLPQYVYADIVSVPHHQEIFPPGPGSAAATGGQRRSYVPPR